MDQNNIDISDFEVVEKYDNENNSSKNNSKSESKNGSKRTSKNNENNINCDDIDNDEKNELNNNLSFFINNLHQDFTKNENNINNIQDEKSSSKNIILEYLENENILKNKDKLISFIEELTNIIISGNILIIPFLDLCPNLIKAYIDSDLDEETGNSELKYMKIFQLLKYNSFISREYLYHIYDYFAHLYYVMNTIDENDKQFKKFNKMLELLNIFYSFNPDDESLTKMKKFPSSFCFMGGGLKFEFKEKIIPKDILMIEIKFLENVVPKLNKNLNFIRFADDKNNFKISFSDIEEDIKKYDFPKIIYINIYPEEIGFTIKWKNSENINSNHKLKREFGSFEEFYFLENFFGQFASLEVTYGNSKKNKDFSYKVKPLLLSSNFIYYNDMFMKRLSIINPKLMKVNYINYLEPNFDIYNYFLGAKPAMPLIPLISGIYKNSKIQKINGMNKTDFLRNIIIKLSFKFLEYISDKKIKKSRKKTLKSKEKNDEDFYEVIPENEGNIQIIKIFKYTLFILNVFLQLPFELIYRLIIGSYHQFEEKLMNICINTDIMYTLLDSFSNFQEKQDFFDNLKGIELNSFEGFCESTIPISYKKSYEQLYKKIMKELFIYNRFWSIKEFFFDTKDENNYFKKLKLKYKQLSYYTKSFDQPILYPILQFDDYVPNFSKYDKNKLFRHDYNITVNYDFNLQTTEFMDYTNEIDPYINETIRAECCLIKEGYHIKGEIILKPIDNNDNKIKDYYFVFCSYDKEVETLCNKKKKKVKKSTDDLCFGSLFHCPKREFHRKIFLKIKDINLILIRNYFKATSAIEIFTTKKNKSYLFNFNSFIYQKNVIKNPIIKAISECPHFQKIKLNSKITTYLDGFYNINRENLIFSLFSEEFPNCLTKKYKLFNRYDLLILINLLSNRSFKDLYQYPVFPTLYKPSKILEKEIKKERDLSQHLGLQDISKTCETRKKFILGLSSDSMNYDPKSNLFEIHYSNPIYTSNYLIRIFPYSLTSIEFQGDGFDSPNRLFYSLQKSLENTLTQKSDLRESIPELYSLPDLYFNKNELKLGTLVNGDEINNILIEDKNEENFKKYKYLEELKNYFLGSQNLDLNSWIDLIFGINQEKSENDKRNYYSKEKYINLNYKVQKNEISNPMNLELVEFGVQPLKIFDEKFPDLTKHAVNTSNIYYQYLINYNLFEFYNSHLVVRNNPDICFKFDWDENSKMLSYINAFTDDSENNENLIPNINVYYKYCFVGNVLGDIIIYQTKMTNNDKKSDFFDDLSGKAFFAQTNKNYKNEDNICYTSKRIKNPNEKILKILSDHYKQIKYIDYNPRLNLFLSYALDGYINIYVFPKCKLVRTIKVSDITKTNEVLKKVVLISSPFPMIFFHDSHCMYVLTINGDFIIKKEYNKNDKIYCCIDKNFGLIKDTIFLLVGSNQNNKKENNELIVGMKSATLPSLEFV